MMGMIKWIEAESEDLLFARKYCLAGTFPASDERCPYAKAKIMTKFSEVSTIKSDFRDVDGIFLCKYTDREMPAHEARLTSELTECPDPKRREFVDALYGGKA
jgi:hypothetical protein